MYLPIYFLKDCRAVYFKFIAQNIRPEPTGDLHVARFILFNAVDKILNDIKKSILKYYYEYLLLV